MMDWSIQHITSNPKFPHGNAHHAEKPVGIIKQLYDRCQDGKLGLLLLKTTPITNQYHSLQAPGNVFFVHQLKPHLPIYCSVTNTCTPDAKQSTNTKIPSESNVNEDIWIKLEPQAKGKPGKITQVLPIKITV